MGTTKSKPIEYKVIDHTNKTPLPPSKNRIYENLILEGGGIKGLSYGSALIALKESGIYKQFKRFAGTSAGAITATLCAVGYQPEEIVKIIKETDFSKFLDSDHGVIGEVYHLLHDYGEHSGQYFHSYIKKLIDEKVGQKDLTFKKLYELKGVELVIVGTDLNKMRSVYFDHNSTPNTVIADAVRISMSVPFLFVPVYKKDTEQLFVDGGLIDNYPIHVFDGEYPGDEKALLDIAPPNPKTLGLKLITQDEECNFQLYKPEKNIESIKEFGLSIVKTIYIANERKFLRPSYWSRTLPIPVPGYPVTKFSLSGQEKEKLISCGREAVKQWIEKMNK